MSLNLNRRKGEVIRIGDDILLTITDMHGGQVSIRIDAPKHVAVWRGEVYDRIQAEKAAEGA